MWTILWVGLAAASGDGSEGGCQSGPVPWLSASPSSVEAGKPGFLNGGVHAGVGFNCGDSFGYTLTFGDGTRQSGTSFGCGNTVFASHVYATPGVQVAGLTVRYACGDAADGSIGPRSGVRTAAASLTVREAGTAPPAAAPSDNWEDRQHHSCNTNPMWGLDYAFVGAALWLGGQAGRSLRRRR